MSFSWIHEFSVHNSRVGKSFSPCCRSKLLLYVIIRVPCHGLFCYENQDFTDSIEGLVELFELLDKQNCSRPRLRINSFFLWKGRLFVGFWWGTWVASLAILFWEPATVSAPRRCETEGRRLLRSEIGSAASIRKPKTTMAPKPSVDVARRLDRPATTARSRTHEFSTFLQAWMVGRSRWGAGSTLQIARSLLTGSLLYLRQVFVADSFSQSSWLHRWDSGLHIQH